MKKKSQKKENNRNDHTESKNQNEDAIEVNQENSETAAEDTAESSLEFPESSIEDSSAEGSSVDELTDEDTVSAEIIEIKDRYMRLLAEYENFRKRSKTEREGVYTDAVIDASKEWLTVLDNIERALGFAEPDRTGEENADSIAEGISLVHKQALEVLERLGIKEIPCEVGSKFDPNIHSAVTHIEDENLDEQSISAVFQKGFQRSDKIIRYAIVQVAN